MIRFSFKKGLVFIEQNTRWQLIRRLVTNKLQFESGIGEIKTINDTEALELWQKGDWVIDLQSLGTQGDVIYLATPQDLASFPEKWQKIAIRRKKYIDGVNPKVNRYEPVQWKEKILAVATEIDDNKPPCSASVHSWWKRYKITQSINSLLPKNKLGYSKKQDARYVIFEEVIKTVYLTAQKLPKLKVVKKIQEQINDINAGRDAENKIKNLSRSTIYRWLDELRQDIVDAARLGADAARIKYRMSMGGLRVDNILDRIEIDHTPLDIIIIDKVTMLPLGRAWLTLAIDKHSRMIMGFYISFNAPSSYSVMQCLKMVILPKELLLARFPDILGIWPACGIPILIAVDNGMDLHSIVLQGTCFELGIQILFCPAATPETKGSIERAIGTLNRDLIHTLPGTVFSSVDERGDYPSEEIAAIDMETLVHLVTKWVVEIYSMTPHRGIGTTPLLKWMESAKTAVIDLPAFPQQLEVIIGVPAKRTAFHYGIELEGLHYNNHILQEMRRVSGENMQVDLKFYEDQVLFVHVFDPHSKEYFQVDCVHEDYAKGLHREVHRLTRVNARKTFGDLYSMPQLMESLKSIEKIIKDAIHSKKMGTRKKGANLLMHDSVAVFNQQEPIVEAMKPVKSKKSTPPVALPGGINDDLPDLLSKLAKDMNFDNENDQS